LLGSIFLLLAGIVGLLMLALWTLTAHHSAWANANLLLFNPLAFVLLPSIWGARKGLAMSRMENYVVFLQLLATLIASILHLVPIFVQQNQPWILFAVPCWLAVAYTLRARY
jgi:hypothetical protein